MSKYEFQLVARLDPKQVNFTVVKELGENNNYTGYFYDTSDGGNGAAEAVFKHLPKLASAARAMPAAGYAYARLNRLSIASATSG
ncbi:MAG: hypothetical protein HWQ38_35260 [Nostoc sp. NMS7]|uniref:DUF1998 domain-containing protein n=1 Tax=Nostoc sp. NMS7 TaxID=2815391 RepID=UPI0025DB299D|nr:DUF1998 domain-containing protein [Nostoc sp. NMS7]MBN3951448.1 hypothetical protein [Nostoc sp. NMS7]